MNKTWRKLSDQYLTALRAHLSEDPEAGLASVAGLAREALQKGVSTHDLALIHEEALVALKPPAPVNADGDEVTRRTGVFFHQTLASLVDATCADRLAKAGKPQTRTAAAELAAVKKRLQRETEKRKAAEIASKESRRLYDRLLAEAKVMQKQLRHLSHELLRAQEEERKKISRELHDEISQILTGITVRLAALKIQANANTGSVTRKISSAQRLVEKSVAAVHRFARELRPAMLDDLGLIPALTTYMKEIRKRAGLQIRFTASKAVTKEALDSPRRTVLYRIAQEAITNVVKHAKASQVNVCLRSSVKDIMLQVSDDGRSFSVPAALANKRCKHLGLIGMRERAEMVGGTFEIDSVPGQGTTVRVHIPLHNGNGHGYDNGNGNGNGNGHGNGNGNGNG